MRALLLAAAASVALLAGCADDGASAASGADALMRVENARYTPGAFPVVVVDDAGVDLGVDAGDVDAGDADGGDVDAGLPPPSVTSVTLITSRVRQGFRGKQVGVLVSPNARTVAVTLQTANADGSWAADHGWWTVPVGTPALDAPPNLEAPMVVDFSSDVPVGAARLVLVAQDELGRLGPPRTADLQIVSALPVTDLVVALDWTADMDLDLLVVQPDGSTLSFDGLRAADGMTIMRMPGQPTVDIDSNAGCVIDGARTEAAAWDTPMPGTYRVFVRPTASCTQPLTGWRVRILRGTTVVATVTGEVLAAQVDAPGGGPTGGGLLATSFVVGD